MARGKGRRSEAALAGLAGLGLAAFLAGGAVATSGAEAAVRSVAPASQLANAGAGVKLTVVGRGPTTFLLSADRRRSRDDLRLGTRRLRRTRTTLRLRIPRTARLGAYRVLACPAASGPGRPPACRASRRLLGVLARPRPATVGPRADAARTATASIGREGGTLAATGADGTRYTLTVPAGALLDATTVTMTPVASIARLPMRARLAGAVQLGPSGRRLLKPASLSITPSRPPARTQLTGFGFASGGGQFHLTPATRTGSDITLRLVELKGHGIGAAGAAARYAFSRTRLPTELSDQAEQVAAALRRPPGGRGRTAQAGPQDDLSAVLWGMFISISGAVHSNLDQAVFQFVTFDMIASTQSWPGQRTVLDWRGDLARVFLAGYQTNSVEARLGCATRKDITQMARLLRYKDYLTTSLAPLLALGLFPAGGVIDDALGKCLRFELIYEASIHGANGYGEAVTAKVRSTVPIRMAAPGILETFLGTAPLEVVDYSVGPVDCYTHTWNVTPQNPLVVRRLALRIWREFGMENLPPTIRVNFNLGSLDEQVTHTCEGSSYTDQQHAYDGVAAALLGGAAGADFELSWEGKGSAGEFSSQEFTRSADVDGGSYTGTFVFRLRHDPTL